MPLMQAKLLDMELNLDDFIPKGDAITYMGIDLGRLTQVIMTKAGPFYDHDVAIWEKMEELVGQEFSNAVKSALQRHKNNLKTAYAVVEKMLSNPN